MKESNPSVSIDFKPLALGAAMALLPSLIFFSALGDPANWPLHLGFAILCLGILLMKRSDSSSNAIVLTWPAILWIGLVIWAWLSPLVTHLFSVAEWKYSAGRLTGYAGILLVGGMWDREKGMKASSFQTFLLGFGAVLSIHYILTFLAKGSAAFEDPYQVPGLLGHKNFTISAIALTMPSVIIGRARHLWPSWLANMVLWIGVMSILMAQTRSIWIGGALALGVGVALGWRPPKSVRAALIAGLALAGLLFLSGPAQSRLMDPTNLRIRQIFWDHSFKMQAEYPLAGVGPGQWRIHFPKYGLAGMNPSVAEGITSEVRPHNDFIWVLSEMGYVGFVLFVAFFVTVLVSAWRKYRSDRENLTNSGWLSVLVLTLVYAFFEFPLERAAFWALFLFMVGLYSRSGVKLPKRLYVGGASMLLIFSAWVSWHAIQAEKMNQVILTKNAAGAKSKGIVQAATNAVSEWNELDLLSNPLLYFAGMGSMFNEGEAIRKEAQSKDKESLYTSENFKEAEAFFNEALSLHPYHVVTLFQMANLHRYRGDLLRAKDFYKRLLSISPRHPGGQVWYAQTLNDLGEYESAARVLLEAFLTAEYYPESEAVKKQNPETNVGDIPKVYKENVIKSLNGMPQNTTHKGLRKIIADRENLTDEQLYMVFQNHKKERLAQSQQR